MSGEKRTGIYYQALPESEYTAHEEERIEDIVDGQLYDLLARKTRGEGPDAFRLVVGIRISQRALENAAFEVIYTDEDLRPVSKVGHPSRLKDRYWLPTPPLPLRNSKFDCVSHLGYFLPHHEPLDDEFLLACRNVDLEQPLRISEDDEYLINLL